MDLLATFYTQSGSLKFLRVLEKLGIKGQLMPVPRMVSASCGVAARFQAPGLVEEMQIDEVERIFQIMAGEYRLLYAKERDWLL